MPAWPATQVVVVGAGPAGASAAFFLAQANVNVLLVDQATFPRDKPCGDAISCRSLEVLARMGLTEWVAGNDFAEPQELLFTSPDGTAVRDRPDPCDGLSSYGYIIPRLTLDAALVERAVAMGARLQDGVRIVGMERLSAHCVRLTGFMAGRSVAFNAPLVIAADGGRVSFTQRLGLVHRPPEAVAVRGYVECDDGAPKLLGIHWERSVAPGYGWIFPAGHGRVNAGIGTYSATVRQHSLNLCELLRRFLSRNLHVRARLRHARLLGPVRGCPLRTDADRVTPLADNVLVAGEAAGLVNPLSGEGIGPSLECGELAAAHACRALENGDFSARGLTTYGRAFHQKFDAFHRSARRLRWLMSWPWIVNRGARRACHDHNFALLFGYILIGLVSPARAFKPSVLVRLLAG